MFGNVFVQAVFIACTVATHEMKSSPEINRHKFIIDIEYGVYANFKPEINKQNANKTCQVSGDIYNRSWDVRIVLDWET
jgi:hypothetical protein